MMYNEYVRRESLENSHKRRTIKTAARTRPTDALAAWKREVEKKQSLLKPSSTTSHMLVSVYTLGGGGGRISLVQFLSESRKDGQLEHSIFAREKLLMSY